MKPATLNKGCCSLKENIENCIKKLRSKSFKFSKKGKVLSVPLQFQKVRAKVLGMIKRINKTIKLKKSARWMPWHQEPMKDVASCDKPWGAASRHRTMDFRMGQPGQSNVWSPVHEYIVYEEGTR